MQDFVYDIFTHMQRKNRRRVNNNNNYGNQQIYLTKNSSTYVE